MFNGHSEGNMMVQESIELRESARVKGNVSSECISMYNGAHVMIDIGGLEEVRKNSRRENHDFSTVNREFCAKTAGGGLWQASG